MTAALLLVLKACVVALLCAIGLGSTPADLTYLLRRPALLFRSLFAIYVAIPLAALAIVQTVPLPPVVRTAILVLAISAGAPLLPRKLMMLGREGYVFSLVVLSSLLAVVAVPAWLVVLGPYFVQESEVGPRAVGLLVAKAALAVSCATRHVGIAMLAASAVPNPRTVAFVLAYLLSAAVVTIPFLKWRARPGYDAGRFGTLPALLGGATRLNIDFGHRQRDNPPTKRGTADTRRARDRFA